MKKIIGGPLHVRFHGHEGLLESNGCLDPFPSPGTGMATLLIIMVDIAYNYNQVVR